MATPSVEKPDLPKKNFFDNFLQMLPQK